MSPRECKVQAIPKCDGVFRVAGGGISTGILPGWIRTAGPRLTGNPHCTWTRLSGPDLTIANTIDAGSTTSTPATVQIQADDYAFATYGCQPWSKAR